MFNIEIRVKEQLDASWSDWFGGLQFARSEQKETIMCGSAIDQAALFGLLGGVQALNLNLVSLKVCRSAEQVNPGCPQAACFNGKGEA